VKWATPSPSSQRYRDDAAASVARAERSSKRGIRKARSTMDRT